MNYVKAIMDIKKHQWTVAYFGRLLKVQIKFFNRLIPIL